MPLFFCTLQIAPCNAKRIQSTPTLQDDDIKDMTSRRRFPTLLTE